MDAFYASIEQRDNPELKGKPVAVGGGGTRGVVAAASYEARRFGVRSAMPGITARKLCPSLIFVKPDFQKYVEVSRQIRAVFHKYTGLVEPLSLDEAYLDVTVAKKGPPLATLLAKAIRREIFEQTDLTASAGVSFNKFLAKVASDINKPNGQKVITPDEAIPFLEALPVEKFHGIGKVTARRMHRMRIKTGADLKKLSELELVQRFGKAGRHYFKIVRAMDNRLVNPNRIRKSIGAERTFSEDITRLPEMKEKLVAIAGKVFAYLVKHENFGRTITLKMKTPEFHVITRSKTFTGEVRSLDKMIEVVFQLLEDQADAVPAVRLLGITVSNLEKEHIGEGVQLEFDFKE
jgi:DNA polymerase IV